MLHGITSFTFTPAFAAYPMDNPAIMRANLVRQNRISVFISNSFLINTIRGDKPFQRSDLPCLLCFILLNSGYPLYFVNSITNIIKFS